MTDLTAKWKAGELGHGVFYVRLFTSAVVVDVFDANPLRFTLYENDIDEVLAPVPSFEDWQALKAESAKLKEKINNISKQTKILRDKVMFWKNGLFCTTEKSALFYVEKVLTNIEEDLK